MKAWDMDEDYMMWWFRFLDERHDGFVLLVSCAENTRYANFQHDWVEKMTRSTYGYYREAFRRGLTKVDISEGEMHILLTAFWATIYEPFIHGYDLNQLESHCKAVPIFVFLAMFFADWKLALLSLCSLPLGVWFVRNGWSTLPDLVLVLCMSFGIGAPLLRSLSFMSTMPQINFKIEALEQLMNTPPLRQADRPFTGKDHSVSFENVRFAYREEEVLHGITLSAKEGRLDATDKEVLAAAEKAQCGEFLARLPHGIHTMAGDGGKQLSGGERQRISLARAILKNAPIMVLDEATASVDADNESCIQQAISELCRGKTLLVIAHRLNTIRNADQIFVVSGGQIVQRGTHEQLMKEAGIYHDFVSVRENSRGWNKRSA